MTIVDLSLPIRPHVRWKTEVTVVSNFQDPSHPFRSSRLAMPGHGFTHCDGFSHFIPGGTTVDRMPIETWVGDAAVVDLTHVDANMAVEAADLEGPGGLAGVVMDRVAQQRRSGQRSPATPRLASCACLE